MREYDDEPDDETQARRIGMVLAKVAAVVVVIGLLVFVGTTLFVKALGLDSGGGATTSTGSTAPPASPLPTSALPVPGQSSSPEPGSTVPPTPAGKGGLQLSIAPAKAHPMQRVNLTGSYRGHDAVSLQVQRFENGQWTSFSGVTASVDLGTFQTYVMTGRPGPQKFRVFDPKADKGSNPVTVVIG